MSSTSDLPIDSPDANTSGDLEISKNHLLPSAESIRDVLPKLVAKHLSGDLTSASEHSLDKREITLTLLYMRHGQSTYLNPDDPHWISKQLNPGLTTVGEATSFIQAANIFSSETLSEAPMLVLRSPLKRTGDSMAYLLSKWQVSVLTLECLREAMSVRDPEPNQFKGTGDFDQELYLQHPGSKEPDNFYPEYVKRDPFSTRIKGTANTILEIASRLSEWTGKTSKFLPEIGKCTLDEPACAYKVKIDVKMFVSGHGIFGERLLSFFDPRVPYGSLCTSGTINLKLKVDVQGSLASPGFNVSSSPDLSATAHEDVSFKPVSNLIGVANTLIAFLQKTGQDHQAFLTSEANLTTLIEHIKKRGKPINDDAIESNDQYNSFMSLPPRIRAMSKQQYNKVEDDVDWNVIFGPRG